MSEEEEIERARKLSPLVVRVLAEIARDSEDDSNRREAIATLRARGVLKTSTPDDDDLTRIIAMADQEIIATLQRLMN